MNYEYKMNDVTKKCICQTCGKEYSKRGIYTHIWRSHGGADSDFNPAKGYKNGTRTAWNKGLTKETDIRIKTHSDVLKSGYKTGRLKHIPRKHTKETKIKLSEIRKAYLDKYPDKVPYLLNHYSKGESYPEEYFRKVFENLGIEFEQEVRVGRYSLDFVINNVDIEIDGEQHYVDKRILESDIRRNKFIKEKGYKLIRVRWSKYQKLSRKEKLEFVLALVNTTIKDL